MFEINRETLGTIVFRFGSPASRSVDACSAPLNPHTAIVENSTSLLWRLHIIMRLLMIFSRYWIDKKSAEQVDERIQKCLFLFACTNSCMNPLVYGAFNIRALRKAVRREVRGRTFTFSSNNTCINTPTTDEVHTRPFLSTNHLPWTCYNV